MFRVVAITAGKGILLHAVELHPKHGTIQFNLACYKAQVGNVAKEQTHLKCAVGIDPKFKLMALEDQDLEPLWALLDE
jgi:hypothetical protein